MQLPAYFLRRPDMSLDTETRAAFDKLLVDAVEQGKGAEIQYALSNPKWQFLCYLCDTKGLLLHGSPNPSIEEFEPRKSNDIDEFGDRCGVYAASDGIWPIYFAIVDRERHVTSLVNAAFRVLEDAGRSDPYYYFSINADALPHSPWRNGTIYVLPSGTFEQQPPEPLRGLTVQAEQWMSEVGVKPLAKMSVMPDDFPFLSQMRPHDFAKLTEQARHDPDGFPWLDE